MEVAKWCSKVSIFTPRGTRISGFIGHKWRFWLSILAVSVHRKRQMADTKSGSFERQKWQCSSGEGGRIDGGNATGELQRTDNLTVVRPTGI